MFDHFYLYRYNGEVGDVVVGRIIEVRITPLRVCAHMVLTTTALFRSIQALHNSPPFFPIPHYPPLFPNCYVRHTCVLYRCRVTYGQLYTLAPPIRCSRNVGRCLRTHASTQCSYSHLSTCLGVCWGVVGYRMSSWWESTLKRVTSSVWVHVRTHGKTGRKYAFAFSTSSERPLSKLSSVIGPTELKLWPFKDASFNFPPPPKLIILI